MSTILKYVIAFLPYAKSLAAISSTKLDDRALELLEDLLTTFASKDDAEAEAAMVRAIDAAKEG